MERVRRFVEVTVDGGKPQIQCSYCFDSDYLIGLQKAGRAKLRSMTNTVSFMPRSRQSCSLCGATALLREA